MLVEKKFFTHLMNLDGVEHSLDPIIYPSFEAAYLEVIAAIPDVAADLLRRGFDPMQCAFLICDEDNRLLETVYFRELVRGSASDQLSPAERERQPLAGAVFRFDPGVRGRPRPTDTI